MASLSQINEWNTRIYMCGIVGVKVTLSIYLDSHRYTQRTHIDVAYKGKEGIPEPKV